MMAIMNLLLFMKNNNQSSYSIPAISLVRGMQLELSTSVSVLQRLQAFTSCFDSANQEGFKPLLFMGTDDGRGLIRNLSHTFAEAEWYEKRWSSKEKHLADLLGLPPVNPWDKHALSVVESEAYLKDMIGMLSRDERTFDVLAIGPLSNLARLVLYQGHVLMKKIDRLVVMGGAVNLTDSSNQFNGAEWNFYCDALSAEIVLRQFQTKIMLFDLKVANLNAVTEQQALEIYEYASHLPMAEHSLQRIELSLLNMSRASVTYDLITSLFFTNPGK